MQPLWKSEVRLDQALCVAWDQLTFVQAELCGGACGARHGLVGTLNCSDSCLMLEHVMLPTWWHYV